MLAFAPSELIEDFTAEPLPRLTSKTMAVKALLAQLDTVRERGVATERDEAVIGEASVAAPIFDHSGHAVGAIGVVGDTDRIAPRGVARRLRAAAAETARGLSPELRRRPPAAVP